MATMNVRYPLVAFKLFWAAVIVTFASVIIAMLSIESRLLFFSSVFPTPGGGTAVVDFCAYNSQANPPENGDVSYCRYFLGLGSLGLVVAVACLVVALIAAFMPAAAVPGDDDDDKGNEDGSRSKSALFATELGTSAFLVVRFLVGAIVITAGRPPNSIQDLLDNSVTVATVEASAWLCFAASVFLVAAAALVPLVCSRTGASRGDGGAAGRDVEEHDDVADASTSESNERASA